MSTASAPARPKRRAPDFGRARAIALAGLDGTPITVEASVNEGLPGIDIIGLPDASVAESRKRIRAALANIGLRLRALRYTVYLSPGGVRKVGPGFDLAIALAVLEAEGLVPAGRLPEVICIGELGLDGRILPVRGVLPTLLAARRLGFSRALIPAGCTEEADALSGVRTVGAVTLAEAAVALGADLPVPDVEAAPSAETAGPPPPEIGDLADVRGQDEARFALEVAAAGGHHMLMVGTPGAGKTLIAGCLPSILPALDDDAAVEVLALRSLDGQPVAGAGARTPPFEAPHHRTTASAMLGASRADAVGVLSRAHRGVLFLDEAPEFSRDVLEALREPIESGWCRVSRAWGSSTLPARFQLILAANPCPCGGSSGGRTCECSPQALRRYRAKLSGPLIDRVDIRLDIRPLAPADVRAAADPEPSAAVRERVCAARAVQADRYADEPWSLNAEAPGEWLRTRFRLTPDETALLDAALDDGTMSMRGYDRVLRIAATLADLAGRDRPGAAEIGTAVHLRTREI